MLDYLHLPDSTNGNIDYFPGFSNTDGGSWVVWEKPRGAHMIRITCIAGGGGGGSGFSSNTTTNRGGGGGGGSSALTMVMIPAYVLPDRLYVSAGVGGAGGAANPATANLGSDGIRSYVCIAQSTGAIYRVCYADSGKAGTTAPTSVPAGGSAGNGGTIATISDMLLASYGLGDSSTDGNFYAGASGASGGTTVAGTNITYPVGGLPFSGGSGGSGGTNSAGSIVDITEDSTYVIISDLSTVTGNGNSGQPGREVFQPFRVTGGTGGAAALTTGSGGRGGDGGIGCGGGGGGAGGAAAAGGGGKGGNGLIIIHTW